MTNIPLARQHLQAILDVRGADVDDWVRDMICDALALMTREPKPRRRQRASTPMTPELREAIRQHALLHPKKVQHEIAAHFNVSQGRVCETLAA
jgi:transposase